MKVILPTEQLKGEVIRYYGNSLLGKAVKMPTGGKYAYKVSTQTPARDSFSCGCCLGSRGDSEVSGSKCLLVLVRER